LHRKTAETIEITGVMIAAAVETIENVITVKTVSGTAGTGKTGNAAINVTGDVTVNGTVIITKPTNVTGDVTASGSEIRIIQIIVNGTAETDVTGNVISEETDITITHINGNTEKPTENSTTTGITTIMMQAS